MTGEPRFSEGVETAADEPRAMTEDRPGVDRATSTADVDLGPIGVEAAENPGSSTAVLWAEVDRLRADLAAARREGDALASTIEATLILHEPMDDGLCRSCLYRSPCMTRFTLDGSVKSVPDEMEAESAGDTDRTEGDDGATG